MTTTNYDLYRSAARELPTTNLAWNLYGTGLESIGRDGEPEAVDLPQPNADQMLVRVDSVGMCFSDVKLIRLGRDHPKLYNRDLSQEPTRLGHEAAITVIEVGENLQDTYTAGQRLAVQPDIYQNGKSTAYGYTIPGGLIQYHLIGAELLETDAGACLLPLADGLGYAESALLEPWGCVMAAYTQRRRLTPKAGGSMWIIGQPGDERVYEWSSYLDAPATVVVSDVNASVQACLTAAGANVIVRDGLTLDAVAAFGDDVVSAGFDDVVMLAPTSAAMVSAVAQRIARRGTLNLVGQEPLDGLVSADVGRLHYDYIAFLGTQTADIAASYGEERNRCELKAGGAAVFIGAGGPMGQMHVQRAIEHPDGPSLLIATELNQLRIDALNERFVPLAEENGRRLIVVNPVSSPTPLRDIVMGETDGLGADDVVVCVPSAGLMAQSDTLMNPDGMLNLFAGVPNGTMAPLNVSNVYMANAQYTGTSGLTIDDQAAVMEKAMAGTLSPSRAVAAIGGIEAAQDGIEAMMESRYPGKIVIFPQISGLPLMGLDELAEKLPHVGQHLGANNAWTEAAERALLEQA